jgi:hypothetical protein
MKIRFLFSINENDNFVLMPGVDNTLPTPTKPDDMREFLHSNMYHTHKRVSQNNKTNSLIVYVLFCSHQFIVEVKMKPKMKKSSIQILFVFYNQRH